MKKRARIIAIALALCVPSPQPFAQILPAETVATLRARYEDKIQLDVLRPHEVAVADLQAKYMAALDRARETAQKVGGLQEALSLKGEKDAVLSGNYKPSSDDPNLSPVIRSLRATYLMTLNRLELERDKKLQPITDAFSRSLDSLIEAATRAGKLDEAVEGKKIRDELRAAATPISTVGFGSSPFVNSIGMQFLPVPGTGVMFCVHETRKKDYAAFQAESASGNEEWKNPQTKEGVPVSDADDHPVVMVSWNDAQAFCDWLSKKENKIYRLPTDREWSFAIGIARDEDEKALPEALNAKIRNEYAWGSKWPPPKDSGNFADLSTKQRLPSYQIVSDQNDGFATTAPVMKFKPNKAALYDLAGNVWEWTGDWFNQDNRSRVLRGGSWYYWEEGGLLASYRSRRSPDDRNLYCGFRCVVETPNSSKK